MSTLNSNNRPEDRHGLTPGSFLSRLSLNCFRLFCRTWRLLPLFRGKVRIAVLVRKIMRLENHHIHEQVTLKKPCSYKANLDLHSWLQFVAFFNHQYECETVNFLSRCYDKKRGYYLDLGANIGLLSLPFAFIEGSQTNESKPLVYSIEAIKSNFIQLQNNIALNNLENQVIPINVGLGECEKTVEIQVEGNLKDGEGTGTANILPENSRYSTERISLEITTIDLLIEQKVLPNNCSLVKIDLDGYDLKALEGASSLLTVSRPVIYGEFSAHCMNWHGQKHQDVEEYMTQFNYAVFYKHTDNWMFSNSPQGDGDLLLLPLETVSEFAWCLNQA